MAEKKEDLSLFERFLPKKLRKVAGGDVARGTATRVGSVGRKSETTIAPGTSTRAVGRGYGVRQRGQGSRAATRSQRDAATKRGTTRTATIAGGAAAAGGTGVALSGSGKKKADKKEKPKVKYNVGVSKGGVPFAEAFKHFRGQGKKTFTWNGKKYTTELKKEGKAAKKPKKAKGLRKFLLGEDGKFGGKRGAIDFLPGKSRPGRKAKDDKKASGNKKTAGERFRDKKAGGGMMSKKGYAKGGMTKKGYAKGGSVRGKPRGVGAAVRGYGKALK
jgi:hypothetical protein